MSTHAVIPDTQVKAGVPTDHLRWIGLYLAEKQPDVIVHLGDHWDMPSLSSYDKGKRQMEGRRYKDDIRAGNEAMKLLTDSIETRNEIQRRGNRKLWKPRKVLLRGNHEYRIERATQNDAELDGLLSFDDLKSPGWEVHDFLETVDIDGVVYSHYFITPLTGRPMGGTAINRLKNLGHSFTMGHQQTLDVATRYVNGQRQNALVCGTCYLHDEDYLGPQGNAQWRGIIFCHEVANGGYDRMEVSLDFLCKKYEGVPLSEFMARLEAA